MIDKKTAGYDLPIHQSCEKLLNASAVLKLQPDDVKKVEDAIKILLNSASAHSLDALSTVHSLEVARIAIEETGLGCTSLICSLLYRTVRTSLISIEEIKERFGEQAAGIMEGLIKVFDLYRRNTSIKTENFRKLLLTTAKDVRIILIMIADKLQLMRTLNSYSEGHQKETAEEVSYLYVPVAHQLGLYTIKSEMEDLAMKYTNHEMYRFIAQKLNETKKARDQYIADFIKPLKAELAEQGLKFDIKGRTKSINSIHNKMKKQGVEFEQVYDLFAIRIIIDSEKNNSSVDMDITDSEKQKEHADCWQAFSVIANRYRPNPRRLRNWLSKAKNNGYESLHITVLGPQGKWVEVQIRTQRMDQIAERGFAAHWKYKGIKGDSGMDGWLNSIRKMLDNPERNTTDTVDNFKMNLYANDVFIFTPKGDLKHLPKGATVLDFAFDIHTEVGKKCAGAKVNNRHVPLRHQLANGDQVEILTSPTQTPKRSWLKIVVTSRARLKLKQALRDIEYRDFEFGRETLVRRLKNWKMELNDQLIIQLVRHFNRKSVHNFFCDIANGKLDVVAIKDYIQEYGKKEPEEQSGSRSAENFFMPSSPEVQYSNDVLVIDRNLTRVDYKLASCCNPVFGDEVFGFVTVSGGIKIHRQSCPNAHEMLTRFGYRIVKAQWAGEAGGSYLAAIKITGDDDRSIVANISQVISKELNLKIRSISGDSKEGVFEVTVTVFVADNRILNTLIKKVKGIKGVLSVSRIDSIR